MKKLLYTIAFFTLSVLFASCSSSEINDMEPAQSLDFTVTFQNVALSNGNIYVVKDSKFYISSTQIAPTSRSVTPVSKVEYFVNSKLRVRNVFAPFNASFDTRAMAAGSHDLNLSYEVMGNDNLTKNATKKFTVVIVNSADELPAGTTIGEAVYNFTTTIR